MISIVSTEIEAAGEGAGTSSTGGATTPTAGESTAKATGVEEHITTARDRKRQPASEKEKPAPKAFTAKHIEVVTRVKRCRHHEYYEILSSRWRGGTTNPSRTVMHRERG